MKIVCLGDSVTWGFPHGPHISWTSMLERDLGCTVINQGTNGNTTGDMLQRFDRAVLSHDPTHLIMMGGINDVAWGESIDRIIRNLIDITEKALAHEIRPIMGLPTAVALYSWENIIKKIRKLLTDYADQIDMPVIDFSQAFYDQKGKLISEYLLPDGGHPTKKGYQAMYEQIDLSIFQ